MIKKFGHFRRDSESGSQRSTLRTQRLAEPIHPEPNLDISKPQALDFPRCFSTFRLFVVRGAFVLFVALVYFAACRVFGIRFLFANLTQIHFETLLLFGFRSAFFTCSTADSHLPTQQFVTSLQIVKRARMCFG